MHERRTAVTEDEFVVFLIGMRVNRWRAVGAWRPVLQAMPRMLAELREHPELGLIKAYNGWMFGGPALVQYWRSWQQLRDYAASQDAVHLPAWRAFNRAARTTDAVGIWHETYRVGPGQWEAIYSATPEIGLMGAVGGRRLGAASTASGRLARDAETG